VAKIAKNLYQTKNKPKFFGNFRNNTYLCTVKDETAERATDTISVKPQNLNSMRKEKKKQPEKDLGTSRK